MSGTTEDVRFDDPLVALRAADHRPMVQRWSERAYERLAATQWTGWIRRGAVVGACAIVFVTVAWRLFVVSQPPVEDSLPMVQRDTPSVVPAGPSDEAVGANVSTSPLPAILVHVAGAVSRPGLITAVDGWRVNDAIEAAGGAAAQADLNRINLAAPIADGQRIFVPLVGEAEPSVMSPTTSASTSADGGVSVININTADAAALQSLPGVGPATASAISTHRDEHGPFATLEALVAVRGIGPATLERIRDRVTVG